MIISIEDWHYLGEGKVRIALANLNRQSDTFGSVLLLQKWNGTTATNQESGAENDVKFIKSVMLRWYTGNYVFEDPRSITLCDATIDEIMCKINRSRPPSRVGESSCTILQRSACLQRNYSNLNRIIPISVGILNDELSIELKVKCGLKATTPFVVGTVADIKLHMSRYRLMQLHKQAKASRKNGWGTFVGLSDYNPLDIFSGHPVRIKTALCTLLMNPQNNFRLSLNSKHIYGWDKQDVQSLFDSLQESSFWECADRQEGQESDVLRTPLEVLGQLGSIFDALAAVLSEEPVLRRLHDMQRLDMLDSEGAAVVYARLVEVVGSADRAMELFEQVMLSSTDLEMSVQPGAVGELASIVQALHALRITSHMSEEEHRVRLAQAHEVISQATSEQCLHLMKMWMLALIAKDASVMVTARRIHVPALPQPGRQVGDMWVSLQSPTHCGTAFHADQKLMDDLGYEGFVYTVGLIDLGLKSLDKVWKKAAEDANVCEVVRKSL